VEVPPAIVATVPENAWPGMAFTVAAFADSGIDGLVAEYPPEVIVMAAVPDAPPASLMVTPRTYEPLK
jgi:hypothetical protein